MPAPPAPPRSVGQISGAGDADRAAALYEGGAGGPVVALRREAQSTGTGAGVAEHAAGKNGYFVHTPCEITGTGGFCSVRPV
ncbi:hypothetical protein GCM10010275_64730 [Streptomyces litmocidini]|nr:hypothetical protein GCM10010275_64730 [Streptomyces litmocidini]